MIRLSNQDALGRRPGTDAAGASKTAHVVRSPTTELNRLLRLAPQLPVGGSHQLLAETVDEQRRQQSGTAGTQARARASWLAVHRLATGWAPRQRRRCWRHALPDGFTMSVKAPRGLTTPSDSSSPRRGSSGSAARGTSSAHGAESCSSSSGRITNATTPGSTGSCAHCRTGYALRSSYGTSRGSTTTSSPCSSATARPTW